jgi:hypothetical protein
LQGQTKIRSVQINSEDIIPQLKEKNNCLAVYAVRNCEIYVKSIVKIRNLFQTADFNESFFLIAGSVESEITFL